MLQVRIDSQAIEKHRRLLMEINRSAYPVAIRQTLNMAAFDTKKNTMPKTADTFVHRAPTFFKANSKVDPATGFDINTMKASVGFLPKPNDKSHSVEDLEEQEQGGNIANRAFVALPKARIGNSWVKNVKMKNRLEKIRQTIVDPRNGNEKGYGHGTKRNFIKSSIYAGKGGYILNQDHNRLMEILSVQRIGRNTKVKVAVIESIKKGREAHVKATHFMRKASMQSAGKMEAYFQKVAEERIARL